MIDSYIYIGLISIVIVILIVIIVRYLVEKERENIKLSQSKERYELLLKDLMEIAEYVKSRNKIKTVATEDSKTTEPSNVQESKSICKPEPERNEKTILDVSFQSKENAPKEITQDIKEEILYVKYKLEISENVDNYAVIRIPKKGCVVRSHSFGKNNRRGFKEELFQKSIEKYFGNHFIISGEVRFNTGKDTRPFEPDIAIIDKRNDYNIRIDVEIDEPYAAITRQPTHCKGDDFSRDTYFADRGWIVIRFSEFQVHTQETECLKYLAYVIRSIDSNYIFSNDLNLPINLETEKLWDILQAQKWEKERRREQYLNHEFGVIPEAIEQTERDFSEQEIIEEGHVNSSFIGIEYKDNSIGYNRVNINSRDKRISFYPDPHIYTIDGIPVPSASTVTSKFFPEFDPDEAIEKMKNGVGWNPAHRYWGWTDDEIKKAWEDERIEAANKGTYLHEQIEKFYLNQPYNPTEEFHLFQQFLADHEGIRPYRTEWRIFDEKYSIAGTIDLIAKNGDEFEIYDWKRSKKVVDFLGNPITTNNWGNCGVGNLSDVPDTSYNHYCLQQSLYRYILESNYGINISRMFLIVLYPYNHHYYKVETPYWRDRIEYILNTL